jgi:hypothetical protein
MRIYVNKELFQWEKNRYILIKTDSALEELPTFAQFYNKKMLKSLDSPVIDNKIKIPNQLLEYDIPVMVVVCAGPYEDAHAISRKEFKIIRRAKPGNGSDNPDEPENPDIPDVPDIPGGDDPIDKDIIYDGGEEV